MRLLSDELDLLKRRESTNCYMELMTRKVADAQGGIFSMVTGSHRDTVRSYNSVRRGADVALGEVSRRLIRAFDCEARSLQPSVRDVVRSAA